MRGIRIAWMVLLAAALLAPAAPVLAFEGGVLDGQVVFGENFTLSAGDVLDGDLVVFGGDVTLEDESRVEGDVVVWGGSVEVAGTVWGDQVVFGGNVHLLDTAAVYGDLLVFGGVVDREEGAEVRGQQVVNPWEWGTWPVVAPFPPVTIPFARGIHFTGYGLLLRGLRLVLSVVLMAGLAGLVAVLWPQPAARVGRAGVRAPLPALGVGLLTILVGFVVVVGLVITLCLAPVGLAAAVAVGVTTVFGWVALGILIGERVLASLTSRTVSPFWSAALGGGLLTLLSSLLYLIPCVGWTGGFLVACVGLGAVVLTRFGVVEYPVSLPAPPVAAEEGTAAEETAEEEAAG